MVLTQVKAAGLVQAFDLLLRTKGSERHHSVSQCRKQEREKIRDAYSLNDDEKSIFYSYLYVYYLKKYYLCSRFEIEKQH